jgi:pimeloyl-ACP methyl ester carboxylesterase
MKDHVVLLHGIWMRGFTLALLARRLRTAGYEVSTFDYASVTHSPEACVARVVDYLKALPDRPVHLVGHSLGGLIALELARAGHGRPGGRVVCLGTPLNGSAVASVLAGWSPLRWTLGEARAWLCDGLACWPDGVDVGMVAGSLPLGFGLLVPGLASPHDGTVSVAETRDARLADHAVVSTSHSGLLLSDRVATMTAHFLGHGRLLAQ